MFLNTKHRLFPAAQGFTLIELVIVLAIIGIIASIAIPKYLLISTESQVTSTKTLAASIASGSQINRVAFATGKGFAVTENPDNLCTQASLARFTSTPIPSVDKVFIGYHSGPGHYAKADCSVGSGNTSAICVFVTSYTWDGHVATVLDVPVTCAGN